jgi:hypothetical protein
MALLTNINGKFSVDTDGAASFNRIGGSTTTGFTFPSADGANGYVLKTNGSGTVSWSPDSSPTVYWAANGNDIYNTNSANVGIGTASPDAKLHVEGGIGIFNVSDDWQQSTLGTYLFRGANFATTISNETSTLKIFPAFSGTRTVGDYWGGINFMHLDPDNSTWGTTYTGANFWVGGRVTSLAGQELSALVFAVNSLTTTGSQPTEKMVILPNGKVGIGTTEPKGVLSVDSGVAKTSTTFTRIASFKTSEAYASFPLELSIAQRGHATSGSQSMELQAGHYGLDFNANLVLQRDGGKVGIGNTNPHAPLSIYTPNNTLGSSIAIQNNISGTGTQQGFYLGISTSTIAYVWNYENDDLVFATNNLERMRINAAGTIQMTDENGGVPILQARNFSTSATGAFTDAYAMEFRGATTTGATGGMMLLHMNEANDARPTLNVSDSNGIFATFTNGKVGIGTDLPAYKLQVSGVQNANDIVINNTTTGVNLRMSSIDAYAAVFTTGAKFLALGTNNSQHLWISDGGNVGVGTGTFDGNERQLKIAEMSSGVVGDIFDASKNPNAGRLIICGQNYSPMLSMRHYSASYGFDIWVDVASTWDAYFDVRQQTSGFRWRGYTSNDGGEVPLMHLDRYGTLTVKGDVIAYGSPSDKRLKENIKPIESALDKVSKLQGVTFDWKKSDSILDIKEDIGFIAQDVQKVIPELVRENEGGMLSMRHQGIAPILLEAIKELKAEIEELKLNKCNCNCNK